MAGSEINEDTGNQPDSGEERKKRGKIYTSSNRIARWIAIFAFENAIVGICNFTASKNFPWAFGFNLFSAILAILCIFTPVLSSRANTKHPPGSMMKSLLKSGNKHQVTLCVISCMVILLGIVVAIVGYVECSNRDEYDMNLANNKCTPDPTNLKYLSVLDGVMLIPMWILLMFFGRHFHRNKSFFKLVQPN